MQIDREAQEIITEIYNLVLEPTEWEAVLDKLAFRCEAIGMNLFTKDNCHPEISKHYVSSLSTGKSGAAEQYLERYGKAEKNGWSIILQRPAYEWSVPEETYDPQLLPEIRKFWEEHLGLSHAVATSLNDGVYATDGMALNFSSDLRRLEYSKEIASMFIPHLAKVFEIQRPFNLLRARFAALFTVLDRIKIGLCILNCRQEVILKNDHASDLLESTQGVWLDRKKRIRSNPDKFGLAIKLYSEELIADPTKSSGRYTLIYDTAHPDHLGLIAEVIPMHDLKGQLDVNLIGTMVYLIDPNRNMNIKIDGLAHLCGLTQAEAEVSRLLVNGQRMKEIAEQRNTSLETIKSQAKKIYNKTNCANHAELVRFAHKIYLPIDE